MRTTTTVLALLALLSLTPLLAVRPLSAQGTPPAMVGAYAELADTILALRGAEVGLVRALLDGHRHAAEVLMEQGEYEGAAAQIAIFANEGDNAVGGVRKRLLEGGHHFNAAGEEAGIFEPGYVIVTREAKAKLLEASADLRAEDEMARQAAWDDFTEIASSLLADE